MERLLNRIARIFDCDISDIRFLEKRIDRLYFNCQGIYFYVIELSRNLFSSIIVARDKENIPFLVEALKKNLLVACPSDTVFALIANVNQESMEKAYQVKARPKNKAFPLMVNSLETATKYAIFSEQDINLFQRYAPGRITFILKQKLDLSYIAQQTIAIRYPNDLFIQELIDKLGSAIIATSANLSNHNTCSNYMELLAQIPNQIEIVVEGSSESNLASTIIDCTNNYHILRQGEINIDENDCGIR